MRQLFPQEIIRNSSENYFIKQNTTSKAVYLMLLAILLITMLLLPLITVDIATQSYGAIRSRYDDNILQSGVCGEVTRTNISKNIAVKQGQGANSY
jgi:membrane fusion protein, peptide pheromone/bacteriocin exporter